MRPRLSYANVMATVAVFIALGGVSYAVTQLPKNSVGSKQLKKSAVTTAKLGKQAVTAAKVKNGTLTGKQIKAETLGTVPTAQTANSLAAHEPWHEVGTPGEPPFLNGWHNETEPTGPGRSVAFFKDHDGVVHFKGVAAEGGSAKPIFELPPGYRPPSGKFLNVPVACGGGIACADGASQAAIFGAGFGAESNTVEGPGGASGVSLESLTFVPDA